MAEAYVCDNKQCSKVTSRDNARHVGNWIEIDAITTDSMAFGFITLSGSTFCSESCLLAHLQTRASVKEGA